MRTNWMRKAKEKSSRNKCYLCGNEFKSEKALCGHMRCHPDRSWRGLKPPAADRVSDPPTTGRHSVPTWFATDKRGRKCIKKRKMIQERVDEEAQIEQRVTYSQESDHGGLRRMRGFDLNELPQVDDDDDDHDDGEVGI